MTTSASWNPFAQNSNKAGIVGSQGREDYEAEDVEYYFNYMGILADEGSNDRMDALLEAGKMLSVCSNGCPCVSWKCPCCREQSHAWTHDVTCAKTARAIIDALQRELRSRSESDEE